MSQRRTISNYLLVTAFVLAVAFLPWLAVGQAQEPLGNVQSGHQIALDHCQECHVVHRGVVGTNDSDFEAPEFWAIADDPAITPISLRVFLRTSHETMPNIILSEQQTDDIIAYILSLR